MKRKSLTLLIIFNTCLQLTSCHISTPEEIIQEQINNTIKNYNNTINDTITLNDSHLYYILHTHRGDNHPIHSQYCKNHK